MIPFAVPFKRFGGVADGQESGVFVAGNQRFWGLQGIGLQSKTQAIQLVAVGYSSLEQRFAVVSDLLPLQMDADPQATSKYGSHCLHHRPLWEAKRKGDHKSIN